MVGMRTTRSAVLAALAASGLLLAGCGGGAQGGSPAPASPTPSALVNFDPCTALTPEELQANGVAPQGKPVDQGVGEVGCEFEGEEVLLTVLKAEQRDLAQWQENQSNFDEFELNQVGSHQGARGIAAGGTGQGVCNQLIEAGDGTVDVVITYMSAQGLEAKDPCADAMKVAQQIEPKLPK